MANVLFVVPVGQDMGGIITSTEQYVAGLRDAGHNVIPICAVFTKGDVPVGPAPRGKLAEDYVPGPGTGWLMHPTAGWRSEDRFSMTSAAGRARYKKFAAASDVVIWASMYGFRNDMTEGNIDWVDCLRWSKTKNIFMIHDDHLQTRYSWAGALAKYAVAFVGVQPCSYASLRGLAAPRAMVYTPLPTPPRRIQSMADRKGFLSCQIWKTWKRADALVAAAPYMTKSTVQFAGDGLQLRYMRSPDKCPPRYAGLWAAAMKKQVYSGVLSELERDNYLTRRKFLVDLSVRNNSGQLNRIVQEAMAQGCVVIANPKFITGTDNDPIFLPGVHYVPINDPYDDPRELALTLMKIEQDMGPKTYAKIQNAARERLVLFDRAKLAQQLVDIVTDRTPTLLKAGIRYELPASLNIDKAHKAEFISVFGGPA